MKVSSKKAKGRSLQQKLAERISNSLWLTILASPPTKPGERPNGAVYVPEDQNPDIIVRRMSQAGVDVLLVSERAKEQVRKLLGWDKLVGFECKNDEALADAISWPFAPIKSARLFRLFKKAVSENTGLCIAANRKEPVIIVPVTMENCEKSGGIVVPIETNCDNKVAVIFGMGWLFLERKRIG